ncbi:hypothetical protein BJF83_25050 [Nocardiopsis sp. CNR-923]|uniref:hypothetical protein n=1 Tax=Nocardiopsis sp. CNR-923 TaxID=1904965 RepID=UPI000963170E|nr:hypothetical protein [Nocardiopsis sp. CNR-923]OLT29850.1 hypothetical protein BJF83_25050 [Nocardiopsis sp. CNR-923]
MPTPSDLAAQVTPRSVNPVPVAPVRPVPRWASLPVNPATCHLSPSGVATLSVASTASAEFLAAHPDRTWIQHRDTTPHESKGELRRDYLRKRRTYRFGALQQAGLRIVSNRRGKRSRKSVIVIHSDGRTLTVPGRTLKDMTIAQ